MRVVLPLCGALLASSALGLPLPVPRPPDSNSARAPNGRHAALAKRDSHSANSGARDRFWDHKAFWLVVSLASFAAGGAAGIAYGRSGANGKAIKGLEEGQKKILTTQQQQEKRLNDMHDRQQWRDAEADRAQDRKAGWRLVRLASKYEAFRLCLGERMSERLTPEEMRDWALQERVMVPGYELEIAGAVCASLTGIGGDQIEVFSSDAEVNLST